MGAFSLIVVINLLNRYQLCHRMKKMSPQKGKDKNATDNSNEKENLDHLEISVEFEQQTMKFKVKGSTKISKMKTTYCERKNLKIDSVRCFNEDGERLQETSTVEKAGLTNGSLVILQRDQTGGNGGA